MNKAVFTSYFKGEPVELYTRVSKAYARKHWRDERIDICPRNLMPGGGWHPNMTMHFEPEPRWTMKTGPEAQFDRLVEDFTSSSCNLNETGYYPAFYKVTRKP